MSPTSEDFQAISQLLARYCMTLDFDDVEGWAGLFVPDGSFKVYGRSWDGCEALKSMVRATHPGLHLGGQPVIEMADHDHARARRNLLYIDSTDGSMRSAVYDDELVRTPEGWRFASTRCRFITPEGLSDRPPQMPKK